MTDVATPVNVAYSVAPDTTYPKAVLLTLYGAAPEGSYDVKLTLTDNDGDVKIATQVGAVIVDNTAPTVAVTYPNGGEYFMGGSSKTITWTATDNNPLGATPIKLEYFDGSTWVTIASGLVNTGSKVWTVPSLNIATAKVRVTAVDRATNSASDVSDNPFTIDSIKPTMLTTTLTSPYGGEFLAGNSTFSITWNAADITDANLGSNPITLEFHNGTVWGPLIAGIANTGSYSWTVPSSNTNNAHVRIRAVDLAGKASIWDYSDGPSTGAFTIDSTAPAVTVTYPTGGEYLAGNGIMNITWTATDTNMAANPITIEGFNGTAWVQIATGEVNDGSYTETVPALDINNANIRVTAVDRVGQSTSDESGNFTIDSTAPACPEGTLTAPVGGDYLAGNSPYEITWTSGNITDTNLGDNPISLYYFPSPEWTWTLIAGNLTNSGNYTWSVPAINTENAQVKLVVTDLAGHSSSTETYSFTIDSTLPVVTVIDPVGDEYLSGDSFFDIFWEATDTYFGATPITLSYYNGTAYVEIEGNLTSSGVYTWTVPELDTNNARVRATATDLAGNTNSAESGNFTIDSTEPEVTLTAPVGDEYLAGDSFFDIYWEATDTNFGATPITLSYYNGTAYVEIEGNLTNSGNYTWSVPALNIDNALVRVTAIDRAGLENESESEYFTIDSTPPTCPPGTLTTPVGDEYLAGNSTFNITWASGNITDNFSLADNPISLYYHTSPGGILIAENLPNSGNYTWSVPAIDTGSAQVTLVVTDLAGNTNSDESGIFNIDSTEPEVTLTAPVGDEYLAGDSFFDIYWEATDTNFGATPITLSYYNGTAYVEIEGNLTNSGNYTWSVLELDINNARVRATATDRAGNSGNDTSDNVVVIDSTPPTMQATTLIIPNGDEYWAGGSSQNITWNATDINDNLGLGENPITLEYWDGGPTSWVQIEGNLPNSGNYTWTVPPVDTDAAQVKLVVTDLAGNSASDASDNPFTIDSTLPEVTLNYPIGDEYFAGNSTFDISWNATDDNFGCHPVILEYWDGAPDTWIQIDGNQTADGIYEWPVLELDIDNARVRVTATDRAGNSNSAESGDFTIDSTEPEVTLTAPLGGEYLAGNSTFNITWEATDDNFGDDAIYLYYWDGAPDTWIEIASGVPNTGNYTWLVPELNIENARVWVTATDLVGHESSSESGDFTIDSIPPSAPYFSIDGYFLPTTIYYDNPNIVIVYGEAVTPTSATLNSTEIDILPFLVTLDDITWACPVSDLGLEEPLGDGEHTIAITACDRAGNEVWASAIFEIDKIADIPLARGWNLMSVPLVPDDEYLPVVLDGIKMDGLMVWYYNSWGDEGGGGWQGAQYDGEWDMEGGLATIEDGKGYWLFMPARATLTVSGPERDLQPGPVLPPGYPQKAGWNLIGMTSREGMYYWDYLWSIGQFDWYPMLLSYHPITGWETWPYYMYPGMGYWLQVHEDCTLLPPIYIPDWW